MYELLFYSNTNLDKSIRKYDNNAQSLPRKKVRIKGEKNEEKNHCYPVGIIFDR